MACSHLKLIEASWPPKSARPWSTSCSRFHPTSNTSRPEQWDGAHRVGHCHVHAAHEQIARDQSTQPRPGMAICLMWLICCVHAPSVGGVQILIFQKPWQTLITLPEPLAPCIDAMQFRNPCIPCESVQTRCDMCDTTQFRTRSHQG